MNTRRHRLLLLMLGGCMELCWIYAWTAFLTGAFFNRPFPLPEVMILFCLAAALTVVSKGRGWRVMTLLTIHAGGLLLGALQPLHHFFSGSRPFFQLQWLKDLFGSSPDFMGWLSILFILSCSVIIYIKGARFAAKPTDHPTLCTRFDLGIAAFFALFFVQFMIEAKGGTVMGGAMPQRMVVPFFLFSLLGIGLARNDGGAERSFVSGYHAVGTIIGFSLVVLAFGTGLILFFLPYLTRAAELGYAALKVVSAPLGPVLIGILKFLFQPKNFRGGNTGVPPETATPDTPVGEGVWAERVMMGAAWVLVILLALAALAVLALSLWYLFRWLMSRTATGRKTEWNSDPLPAWLKRKLGFLLSMLKAAARAFKSHKTAGEIYAAFQRWGRRSGLARVPHETPKEYGNRMKGALPRLEPEFAVIIDAFNEEVYGENHLDEIRLDKARRAMHRLKHPSLWFSRIKLLFVFHDRTAT
jgi:Domain of unknown function (DUF4129)